VSSSTDPFKLDSLRQRFSNSKLAELEPVSNETFLNSLNHGDLPGWLKTLDQLPPVDPSITNFATDVRVGTRSDCNADQLRLLQQCLELFIPWRKGPFSLFDVELDSEWRSNLKWDRLIGNIQPLSGRKVLDVGCGNGYHCFRAIGEGADLVLGLEPYLIYVMQFLAIKNYVPKTPCYLLPIRLEQFPGPMQYFDTVFSMGVIYHQRSPVDHLLKLKDTLAKGGELILETLVIDGDNLSCLTPKKRYARMSNVWFVPSPQTLTRWLERCGYIDINIVDTCVTDNTEQRKTSWMPFQSLADSLDPDDPTKTIEGLPAPKRSIVVAKVPE